MPDKCPDCGSDFDVVLPDGAFRYRCRSIVCKNGALRASDTCISNELHQHIDGHQSWDCLRRQVDTLKRERDELLSALETLNLAYEMDSSGDGINARSEAIDDAWVYVDAILDAYTSV